MPHLSPIRPARIPPLLALLVLAPCGLAAAGEGGAAPGGAPELQEADEELLSLDEIVITAMRSPREAFETPAATDVVSATQLRERAYRTTPEALRDVPGVMVQETSHGQGSPYIRGFTGFRNVFLIDGIRLNNSVFREGPNQYWNTVDPLSLERLEVVKGPGSVLYGSDAIGGTVNAITKSPYGYGGLLAYRGASAENSHIGRGELSGSYGDSLGFLLGLSRKDFGDLDGGRDIGTQPNTGYDEWDGDLKLEQALDPDTRLLVAYQNVHQDNVPRTHKTIYAKPWEGTSVGSDLRRDLDQERQLAYTQLHGDNVDSFFDTYRVSLSWQRQEETRDRVKSSGSGERQGFDVNTLGLFAHLSSETSIGRLTYGVDYYHDEVDSFSSSNPIQGPVADDASYDLLGVFVQDEIAVNRRLDLILAGRFNYASADARDVFDPATSSRISIDDDWSSVVGSARFLYRLVEERINLFGGVSQGFRAPNLSDLTRLDSARTNEFEIPSPGLDPEHYLTWEIGLKLDQERVSSQLSLFYTDIDDQIVRYPTGNTNAAGEVEITKDNVGDGYVYGVELGASGRLAPEWTLFGSAAFVEGKVDTYPTSAPVSEREYIDRLMPFSTQLGLRWDSPDGRRWAELLGVWADDADRLSPRDASDTSRIPPGGTPDYLVFHLRGGWRLSERATLQLALENLTDEDYRIHGSGQNMPGVNAVFSLSLFL